MNCAETQELLSSYYDGELSGELAAQVEQHVAHCSDCQAELASFQQLSAAICAAPACPPAAGNWQRIAARLEEPGPTPNAVTQASAASDAVVVRPGQMSPAQISPSLFGGARTAAALLALAAAVLLMVGLRTGVDRSGNEPAAVVASAVDYEDVLQTFQREPQLAIEQLSKRYDGREVSAEQATALLGFRPSIAAGLPSQARLVSTRVLKLPQCKCEGGKCTCAPGQCNCAACLCERPDGTKFLVFEQCKTQDVTFGNLPSVIARRDSHDVQFIKSPHQLAASWVQDDRRLTAIGLKNEAEAESLIAALGESHG
ncbi:MAG: anti-sigma factor family protein [Aureliella sp.]